MHTGGTLPSLAVSQSPYVSLPAFAFSVSLSLCLSVSLSLCLLSLCRSVSLSVCFTVSLSLSPLPSLCASSGLYLSSCTSPDKAPFAVWHMFDLDCEAPSDAAYARLDLVSNQAWVYVLGNNPAYMDGIHQLYDGLSLKRVKNTDLVCADGYQGESCDDIDEVRIGRAGGLACVLALVCSLLGPPWP